MKKFKEWLFMGLTAVLVFGTSACSSSDDEPATPTFPDAVQTISCVAESEANFTFAANMEWKLSSNKAWCTLASADMEGQNISGKPGSQSVKVKVSGEGQSFDSAKASLTLSMGGQSKVVAEVLRAGKAYELKVYDADGKEISGLVIPSEGTLEFSIEANFECGLVSIPNWLEVNLTSDNNITGKKNGIATVKEAYVKNPQAEATLTFSNEMGTASFPVSVAYAGMAPKAIIVRSLDIESGSMWGWNVSLDGKTFSRVNDLTSETDVVEEKMSFNVIALNDAYKPVFIEERDGEYVFDKVEWMHLEADGETATLTVDASDKKRNGIVLVFPIAVYDIIKDDLRGNIIEEGEIKYEYEQRNLLVALTQKNEAGTGFIVKNGLSQSEYACEPETNEEYLAYFASEYSVEEVYTTTIPVSSPIMIYPNLSIEEWDVSSLDSFLIRWLGGEQVTDEEMGQRPEGAMDGNDVQYMMIRTPKDSTRSFFIVFKGRDTLNKKILLINPQ